MIRVHVEAGKNTNSVMEGIRVEAMKSHALAEQIKVETMGLPDSWKSPISRGFPEIVDMFPRTYGLEADEANFDFFR